MVLRCELDSRTRGSATILNSRCFYFKAEKGEFWDEGEVGYEDGDGVLFI